MKNTPPSFAHPWHEVPTGSETPQIVTAIIEIAKGSKGKFELDKETGMIKLDRVLYSAVHYPANYGFIPQTYCEDKDPLDILVITSVELPPLCMIEARVIGVMRMIDQGEADDKIIAVAHNDMAHSHIHNIYDLAPHTMKEIKRFFEDYKALENKEVRVEDMQGRQKAYEIIADSIELYQQTFKK
jgi:inorganic pyrophosphatase